MALAVPLVMAHRVLRMTLSGPRPSARDRAEFERMWAEKISAFAASWQGMASQGLVSSRRFGAALLRDLRSGRRGHGLSQRMQRQLRRAALNVVRAGLAPLHGKATANARRLSRTRHL